MVHLIQETQEVTSFRIFMQYERCLLANHGRYSSILTKRTNQKVLSSAWSNFLVLPKSATHMRSALWVNL